MREHNVKLWVMHVIQPESCWKSVSTLLSSSSSKTATRFGGRIFVFTSYFVTFKLRIALTRFLDVGDQSASSILNHGRTASSNMPYLICDMRQGIF